MTSLRVINLNIQLDGNCNGLSRHFDNKAWAYQFHELSLSNWSQQQQQHPWVNSVDLLLDIFYLHNAVAHVESYLRFACPWLSRCFLYQNTKHRISSGAIFMSDNSEQLAKNLQRSRKKQEKFCLIFVEK